MKENLRMAWAAAWFALVGQLSVFVVLSILTDEWRYAMWSFMVSMMAGVPGIIVTWQAQRKSSIIK
ncbi:hypothetical protein H8B09_14500 [Paenibacillus sp. PR3]|uniref:Uncharacterized protein n=1 Tax=Paenibacillus terricola TaxID=2763503 RepID=A0ABR8MY43_9BACL|nr:hypothetical protein [Paenibacillus terricola]MBD3919971.1 hypothetical protein [Paenibacillus terricola]